VTHTDNHHYIAGSTCILLKQNFWWIMSTDGKMDEEKKKEIIHSFEQQGFRKNNLATDNDFQVKTISYLGEHCGAEHHFKKDEDFSGDPEKDE